MDDFFGRSVFFVRDAEQSLSFYTKTLGFALDWNHQVEGRAYVFQVSLFGFQLILNQIEKRTEARAGHGRVFVGLDNAQSELLRQHIKEKGIESWIIHWGEPTRVIRDPDGNELYFSLPQGESGKTETD